MSRILTPSSVLETYAANQLQEQGVAVCLFVDTAGFTPLTSTLVAHGAEGAEVLAQVLADIFTPLLALVYAQGGYVAGFAGDAFKAIFPGLGEESYQRAVTAAWQIRQQMLTNAVQSTRFGDFRFAVKITMASGPVEWRIWRAGDNSTGMAQRAALLFGGSALAQALAADPLAQADEIVMTAAVAAQLSTPDATLEAIADHFRLRAWSITTPSVTLPAPHPSPLTDHFFPSELLLRQTQGEFRQVVTVFINLQMLPSGETAKHFAATLFRLLAQYGGYLCRIGQIGDRDPGGTLLLFWGAPTSHENDVTRALHFALALQAAAPTPIRIGVTTALAYAGFVGSPLREEYTCYGAHVNLAARQMVMAGWGEIWLDEETTRLAGPAFTVTLHSQLRFKGFAEERPVYRLLRHQPVKAEPFYTGMMVGRAAELTLLQSALAPLAEGKSAGLITVIGEAGMGKSRLVYELQRQLEGDRVKGWQGDKVNESGNVTLSPLHPVTLSQWFRCQTDEILRHPLNPFRYWLRTYFNQSTSADEAANKQAFTNQLDDLMVVLGAYEADENLKSKSQNLKFEITRTRSFLAALVDLHWPDSLYAQVEPQLRLENTWTALKSLVLAESLRQPVILHLEDAHWLDADSQSFLTRLLQDVPGYPLAVFVTRRPVEETGRQGDKGTEDRGTEDARLGTEGWGLGAFTGPQLTIRLNTLTAAEIRALAAGQLPGAPSSALVNLLLERAEGNPFFVEQLLRYLQEEAWLAEGPAGWQLRSTEAAPTRLPSGARALLVARLDRLPQPVKEVVQTAAVLGREFDTQVLSQMLVDDTNLADKLVTADQAAIWSAISQARYLFRHALLREAAYEMQLRAQVRRLHQRAGDAIRALFAERLAPYYPELAYHYDQAEIVNQAIHWYGLAGEQAAATYANRDALHAYSRALQLTPAAETQTRFQLLVGREEIFHLLGEVEAQREDLDALAAIAGQLGDATRLAQAELRRASHFRLTQDFNAALLATERAAVLAAQQSDPHLLARTQQHWGRVLWGMGKYDEGQRHLEQALQLAQQSHDQQGEAEALTELGSIDFCQARYSAAQQRYTEALTRYQTIGKRQGEIGCLAMLGTLASETADYECALTSLQEAYAVCQLSGYAYGAAFVLGNLATNYIQVGRYASARQCLAEALTNCRKRQDIQSEAVYLDSLAVAALHEGDYAAVIRHAGQALAIQQASGFRRFEAYSLTYLGDAHRHLSTLSAAVEAYEQALAIRRDLGEEKLTLEILAGLAQCKLTQGDTAEAHRYVTMILAALTTQGVDGVEFPVQLYLACYRVLQAIGEVAQAAQVLVAGYELLQGRTAKLQNEGLRQSFLQEVPFNREINELWCNLRKGLSPLVKAIPVTPHNAGKSR